MRVTIKPLLPIVMLVAGALSGLPGGALACGENQFSTGHGLRYQGFLAPRPATVVVMDDGSTDRDSVYAGLAKAGHLVTVVPDSAGLRSVLADSKVDVVIADLSDMDTVSSNAPVGTRVLPVVARSARNAPEMRQRFETFLLEGASLGQYLKSIDRVVGTVQR